MILKDEISMILTEIFNLSLTSGKFIDKLKMTRVIPLCKNKGSEQDKSNYRPIAILSNIDKIFEKLVHQRFVSFLEKNDAIFERQFGFREKHSTTQNLITITETIRKHLNGGEFSCAVFLDLQKAFDSVDHEILLKKMEHYGFRGKAKDCLLYTSPSPRDQRGSRMPSSA